MKPSYDFACPFCGKHSTNSFREVVLVGTGFKIKKVCSYCGRYFEITTKPLIGFLIALFLIFTLVLSKRYFPDYIFLIAALALVVGLIINTSYIHYITKRNQK